MNLIVRPLIAVCLILSIGVSSFAFGQVKARVRFPRGASSTSVKGTVRGYTYRDYIVRGSADQMITTTITSGNRYTALTIFRPDGENLEGAAERAEFTGVLPVTGDYVIRVGMMRAGARQRGSVSNFRLFISID